MHFASNLFGKKTLLALSVAAFASGCSDGENKTDTAAQDNKQDNHQSTESFSRVAVSEFNSNSVYVLNANNFGVVDQFAMTHSPSALKTSPDGRYALAFQRKQNIVEVIDSGISAEAHGDHFHLHSEKPSLLNGKYESTAPTHYDLAGSQAALFFDGDSKTGVNAEFRVIDDATIGTTSHVASYPFNYAVHGTAQIFGEHVFTGIVDNAVDPRLPNKVVALELHNDHFHELSIATDSCPSLHGSAQSKTQVAFACNDGVIIIDKPSTTPEYTKITNPGSLAPTIPVPDKAPVANRLGKVMGFKASDKLLFIAKNQQAFQLKQGILEEVQWKEADTERYLAYIGIDSAFLVLSSTGKLKVFDPATNFAQVASVKIWDTVPVLDEPKNQKFSIVHDKRNNHVFVTDPKNKKVFEVELGQQPTVKTHELSFIPHLITWVGTTEQEHHH
ncbi:conserved hypothetical protein [Vibrio nigripulchritudo SO65]|uniref:hypothetical protein n=1 Tax=Vibrio nigripulchritudo TaxID=28173 RepID=UPI0003B19DA6|nr:hypothetical protein [Vibrio nigripulchritudo]CCN35367.1 conserved hypothetical protein [Vibrio nigripulchritudo AM115]CCN39407.1 conserved hypothetical protein [Vibrio nigripulchritudo FTn2]CCN63496.1 conserved hypothetical protein [Vibrio nigripulchritudo POn4]CCN78087.1 conserved hypothetical protein [Vibrio nigripulchritudo SO65]